MSEAEKHLRDMVLSTGASEISVRVVTLKELFADLDASRAKEESAKEAKVPVKEEKKSVTELKPVTEKK